jgi:hypothetical protein
MFSKKFIIIYLLSLGSVIIVSTFYLDIFTFNSTKNELKLLYETEFDNCRIVNVIEDKYPSAGYYKKFKVDCNAEYFPVLLENMNLEKESYFKEGSSVSKDGKDYNLIIRDDQNLFNVSARLIEHETGLGPIARIMIISLMLIVPIVLYFIPDYYFKIKNAS